MLAQTMFAFILGLTEQLSVLPYMTPGASRTQN